MQQTALMPEGPADARRTAARTHVPACRTGTIMDARPNSPEARDISYHMHGYTN
ncbi:MAG: aspartate aminotransferase family protein, partial [Mesorhizobium sp.]